MNLANMNEFELAAVVLDLTSRVAQTELSTELMSVANRFIDQVKAALPKEVELHLHSGC